MKRALNTTPHEYTHVCIDQWVEEDTAYSTLKILQQLLCLEEAQGIKVGMMEIL